MKKEMATNLLVGPRRMVAYVPSLRAMVKHFRTFSSYERTHDDVFTVYEASASEASTNWPDERMGPLSVRDRRFPMPGNIGEAHEPTPQRAALPEAAPEPDVLTELLPGERHVSILQQYMSIPRNTRTTDTEESEDAFYADELIPGKDMLECQAFDCPALLRTDFQTLFPLHDLSSSPLTVLTLSQRTRHDMSGWSPDVEEERECLLEQFIGNAIEMCNSLQNAGFWADFIDPSSGKPYIGDHTNTTMFETDERYKHFGFEIEDLGCCKVIRHHVWGSHLYVGCLFTNAPANHPVLIEMSQKLDWEDE